VNNKDQFDDERLSALLDGRLNDAEREALLAHLASSDEDYEVFARTASILYALDEEDRLAAEAAEVVAGEGGLSAEPRDEAVPAPVPPVPESRGRPVPVPPPIAPGTLRTRPPSMASRWRWAAGVVTVLLVGVVVGSLALRGRPIPGSAPVQLAANLDGTTDGLPADGRVPWSGAVRGADGGGDVVQAVRAGVLLTDLAVAVEAGDSARVREFAEMVSTRFERPFAGSPLVRIQERAGAPADELRPLVAAATERLEKELRTDALRLGAWAEAARLAAHRRDEAFFRLETSRATLRRAARIAGGNAEAEAALGRVRGAIPAEGAPRWDALRSGLEALIATLAS
jgi:hypothetical protein